MTSTEDTNVSFCVTGFDGSPDQITKKLGIDPDKQWIKGDPIDERGGIRTHSRWEIIRPIQFDDSLQNQLAMLLDVLEPHADAIRSVASNHEAGICVYGYIRETTHPVMNIEPGMLARMSGLGLSLDFDFYAL